MAGGDGERTEIRIDERVYRARINEFG